MAKKKDPGLYVGVNFSSNTLDRIVFYQTLHHIPNCTPRDKLHSTVVYSRVTIPWEVATDLAVLVKPYTMTLGTLPAQDGKTCLVMKFACPYLRDRFNEARARGATFDYPVYTPHITLSYDIGAAFQWSSLPQPDFDVVIVGEYQQPLNEDWCANPKVIAARVRRRKAPVKNEE